MSIFRVFLSRHFSGLTRPVVFVVFMMIPASCGLVNREAAGQRQKSSVETNYDKTEYRIPMRDGTKLYTTVYSPKDKSKKYPFILKRTPYSCAPYGKSAYSESDCTIKNDGERKVHFCSPGRSWSLDVRGNL